MKLASNLPQNGGIGFSTMNPQINNINKAITKLVSFALHEERRGLNKDGHGKGKAPDSWE